MMVTPWVGHTPAVNTRGVGEVKPVVSPDEALLDGVRLIMRTVLARIRQVRFGCRVGSVHMRLGIISG